MLSPTENKESVEQIFNRILIMLINDAFDIVFMQVASSDDVDLAKTKVVNYPKGLLASVDEIGLKNVLDQLQTLFEEYGDDRYRPNPLLKRMVGRLFGDLAKKKASEEAWENLENSIILISLF